MFNFSLVEGIIFDLDDTLVESKLNFGLMKEQIGCPIGEDILTFIDQLSCPIEKERANNVVLAHEMYDANTSVWMPGAEEFVHGAIAAGLPLAIVTRNCKQATEIKISQNNIPIKRVLTREDAPAKPDPTALLMIAQEWQIIPAHLAYIGDYVYDIQAAHNGNMQAWLFDREYRKTTDIVKSLGDNHFAQKLRYIPAETS